MSRTAQRLDRITRCRAARCHRVDLRLARLGLIRQVTVPLQAPKAGNVQLDRSGHQVSRLLRRQLTTLAHGGRWLN
ncbi:hypothetical protein NET02_07365 [Thermomicrobiaceae bacterium CFH 74404]|uniref:Uncharacterized protein n=2 Tax=Thermomicrobia TaxID=189775 RepID=A0AA41WGF8_9BACT|nr:hypothetical protein [Thermalbibacter longus]MCM8748956.1 hypothetical protein [Thermalbibacter longus]